jgi:hypothetical protein
MRNLIEQFTEVLNDGIFYVCTARSLFGRRMGVLQGLGF